MTVSRVLQVRWLLVAIAATLVVGCRFQESPKTKPSIPRAEKIPKVFELHGDRRVDDYYWLRERENPKVLAYLNEENAYAEAMLEPTLGLQEKLYDEFVERLQETDVSPPVKHGEFLYYTRLQEDADYSVHCRKRGGPEGSEEVLLDENELARGHDYFALGLFEVSPNHQRLAFAVDTTGAERFTLRFKDLKSGRLFDEKILATFDRVAWAADNETIFYVTLDKANRPYRVHRHKLGDDPKSDDVVYEEPDEAFFAAVRTTSSRAYVLMEFESITSRETRFLAANTPTGEFTVFHPREPGLEYMVEHQEDRFLVLTNDQAKNFRLVETPITHTTKEHWRDVVAHRGDVKIESLDVFSSHVVLTERVAGLPAFEVRDLKTNESHHLEFKEPSFRLEPGPNVEFETTTFRFSYDSFLTPLSIFDYEFASRTRVLKKQDKVLGGYDPTQYTSERIFAVAGDGMRVPISLVYKKSVERAGKNPCLLQAYGAYGVCEDPYFDSDLLSLLDRGFVVAIAHPRGGGELGRDWYEAGKLLAKKNTFSDFIACAEHLVAQKYTSADRLAILGGSAGGLVMGVVCNMRPDLFRVVIAEMPFVDVVTTMLDPTIPLTVTEYEEWGNPLRKEDYDVLRSYSPYDNVKPQAYPHLLILGSLNDTRVAYWEPAKWAAKLRANKTDENLLLLKTNLAAGHAGGSGRYELIEERAMVYAFMLDKLGIK